MSFAINASFVGSQQFENDEQCSEDGLFRGAGSPGPRICLSADQTKICIQNIGKYGQSHIRVMDTFVKSNERYFLNPLRNSIVIGITNCGKNIILARQCSRKNFKILNERGLFLHVHEMSAEIFDGFYFEEHKTAIILTHLGEIFKIDLSKCYANHPPDVSESLVLKQSKSAGESERVQMRIASIDIITNLLWIYVECEDIKHVVSKPTGLSCWSSGSQDSDDTSHSGNTLETRYRSNNPFLCDLVDTIPSGLDPQTRLNYQRKIFIIDITTFDVFSAFTLHTSFGEIIKLRTSLIAFCQLSNPLSSQFSSRIISIGPTGRYEHLLSFSDVVDFAIDVPSSHKRHNSYTIEHDEPVKQRLSKINRLFTKLISSIQEREEGLEEYNSRSNNESAITYGTLTNYYRSLMNRRGKNPSSSSKNSFYSRGSKSSSVCSTELGTIS